MQVGILQNFSSKTFLNITRILSSWCFFPFIFGEKNLVFYRHLYSGRFACLFCKNILCMRKFVFSQQVSKTFLHSYTILMITHHLERSCPLGNQAMSFIFRQLTLIFTVFNYLMAFLWNTRLSFGENISQKCSLLFFPQCAAYSLSFPQCAAFSLSFPQCAAYSLSFPQCAVYSLSFPQCAAYSLSFPHCAAYFKFSTMCSLLFKFSTAIKRDEN